MMCGRRRLVELIYRRIDVALSSCVHGLAMRLLWGVYRHRYFRLEEMGRKIEEVAEAAGL